MKTRRLGKSGPEAREIGFGCMGISEFYGRLTEDEGIRVIQQVMNMGVTLFDTADMYGPHVNEVILGKAVKGRRGDVVIATKFGIVRGEDAAFRGVNGRPEYVKQACDASLQRLGIDCIDLYYQHRVDPSVPIEDTVGAMAELVQAGKVRHIGLSEAAPATIRRAHAVHPITALQTEYSLWTRDPEDGVLDTVRDLGIAFVAYSPLGRGFLSGSIKTPDDFAPDDWRRSSPRFMGENFSKNLALVDRVRELADEKGVLPGQLALAWLLSQGNDVIPIPGTTKIGHMRENIEAADIELTPDDLRRIDEVAPRGVAAGDRYPDMSHIDG